MLIPFSPLEQIFAALDRPEQPVTIQIEVRLAGELDEDRLRMALSAAIGAHPMTRVSQASGRFMLRPPQWKTEELGRADVLHSLRCTGDESLSTTRDEFYSQAIDLARAPALRALLVRRDGGDSLLVSASHAITDGIGALRFVHSVSRAYAGRPDPAPAIDPLMARNLQTQLERGPARRTGAGARPDLFADRRSHIAPDGATNEPGYGLIHMVLPEQSVNRDGLSSAVTYNDLLLAALHLTIGAWTAERHQRCNAIAVTVPTNLRPPEWRDEVVANLAFAGHSVSTAFERSTVDSLVTKIARQTQSVRANEDAAVAFNMRLWRRLLRLSQILVRGNKLLDTAILSNLGRIDNGPEFGPGAGPVTEVWFSPPVAMPTGLALGVTRLRGQVYLVMRYRQALLGPTTARRFCALFLETLERTLRPSPDDRDSGESDGGARRGRRPEVRDL